MTSRLLWAGMVLLVLAACSSAPVVPPAPVPVPAPTPSPAPRAGTGVDIPSQLTRDQANDVTLGAIGLVGTPYRWGGNTPESGFDCSGLIGYVYRLHAGITPPRTVAGIVNWGQAIPADALRAGDLVVFSSKGISNHAGIYVGEGRFVHAPSTGGEVRLDSINSKYWSRQPVSFRRP